MLKLEKLEIVVNEILKREYDEILTHTDLSVLLDVEYKSKEYFLYMTKIKKLVLEKGKALENIHGTGYRIVNPDNYSSMAINQYKLGFNRLSKGEKILKYAPTKDMTQEGLNTYRQVADRANQLHASLAGGIVELKLLNRKKEHPLLHKSSGV